MVVAVSRRFIVCIVLAGEPFELDPQHVLRGVIDILQKDRLNSILATEFEFYLINETDQPEGKSGFCDLYSISEINRQSEFINRIIEYSAAQNIPIGNIISEYGAGQWEVNLAHCEAMQAVREGVLLKRIIYAAAQQSGKRATFMAKPYSDASGSGLHIHISLWKDGKNCFADETLLLQAVAGILAITNEAAALFAPFDNSYRRFVPGNYAPYEASWGHENRSVAVRLPVADTDAEKRLEFRLCGADANPILAAAALLAGIHWGIARQLTPPVACTGSEACRSSNTVPLSWRAALDALSSAENSAAIYR